METADTLFIFVRPSWVSTLHFLPDKQTKLLSRAARRPSGVGAAEESYFVARFSEAQDFILSEKTWKEQPPLTPLSGAEGRETGAQAFVLGEVCPPWLQPPPRSQLHQLLEGVHRLPALCPS
uniref:Uncharacterized protein n=1 Tax=Molossus molossus TaxID=27622 RepID=A0A7J8CRJ8_MOLMO|nr:hypothetical protein HJG59_009733 [Molossus molossus]